MIHKSAVTDHAVNMDHTPNWDDTAVLAREDMYSRRTIKEAIWIRRTKTMNRNAGDYTLSDSYNDIIQHTTSGRGRQGSRPTTRLRSRLDKTLEPVIREWTPDWESPKLS